MNRDLIAKLGRRCREQKIATVDQDSTIIESHKREALPTYQGERGYQPMLAVWAETGPDSGRRVSRRERPADAGAVAGGSGGVCRAAGDGERVLLSRRFGLPRARVDRLAAGRAAAGRTGGLHRFCHQCADEPGRCAARSRPCRKPSGKRTANPIRKSSASVPRCRLCPPSRASAETSAPLRYVAVRIRKQQGDVVCRWQRGETLRRGEQSARTGPPADCWNGTGKKPEPSKPCITC